MSSMIYGCIAAGGRRQFCIRAVEGKKCHVYYFHIFVLLFLQNFCVPAANDLIIETARADSLGGSDAVRQ